MEILKRIWHDVRRGENIDLYLIVAVVFILGIVNIIGSVPSSWITSATLAALGVIAISALRSDHQMEGLSEKLSKQTGTVFSEEFPPTLKNDINQATELWLVGVSLSRTIKTYYSDIESKLQKGQSIRVLLVNPDGAAVGIAETRVYGRTNIERTKSEIQSVLMDLCDLRKIAPDKLEIRTIENSLTYGAVAVNPNSASGVLYLEHYPYKTVGGSKPKFILTAKDDAWYGFFKDELQILWNNGCVWKCE